MSMTTSTIDLTEGSRMRRFWLVVAGWTAVSVIYALVLRAQEGLPLIYGLPSGIYHHYVLGALVWMVCSIDARFELWKYTAPKVVGLHLGLGLLALSLHFLLEIGYQRFMVGEAYWEIVYHDTWMFQLLSVAMTYAAGVGLGLSVQAFDRDQERQRRDVQLQVAARETELAVIKAQLQPHFLLNSLNSILALIKHDAAEAEHMVTRLASLLHSVFDRLDQELVPLGPELDMVRDYLEIERIRFPDRLRFSVDGDDAVRCLQVPPLLLQPIVENAVKHGVAPHARPGEVCVHACRVGDRIHIAITDTGEGVSGVHVPGSGRGVELTARRLEAQYGEGMAAMRTEGTARGFTVTLDLPVIADAR